MQFLLLLSDSSPRWGGAKIMQGGSRTLRRLRTAAMCAGIEQKCTDHMCVFCFQLWCSPQW